MFVIFVVPPPLYSRDDPRDLGPRVVHVAVLLVLLLDVKRLLGAANELLLLVLLRGDGVRDLLGDALVPVLVLGHEAEETEDTEATNEAKDQRPKYLEKLWKLLLVHDQVAHLNNSCHITLLSPS